MVKYKLSIAFWKRKSVDIYSIYVYVRLTGIVSSAGRNPEAIGPFIRWSLEDLSKQHKNNNLRILYVEQSRNKKISDKINLK